MPKLLSESELHALRLDIQEALASSEQNLIDSLMDHVDAQRAEIVRLTGQIESVDYDRNGWMKTATENQTTIDEQKAKIDQQAAFLDSLAADRDRLQAQHDKAVTENKGLHQTVDSHLALRAALEKRAARAEEQKAEAERENYALRKRNGKLAKKLEMARI